MHKVTDLVGYYAARVAEYERVYEKPERQADLSTLRSLVAAYFSGSRVLEVACGTGYWTAVYSPRAASVVATDKTPAVLELARSKGAPSDRVRFEVADAYDIGSIEGDFNSCFAGFWWSHVPYSQLPKFLYQLHRRLGDGARMMFLDNRFIEGSSTRISRVDRGGNTYQRRRLEDGSEFEVLKNFPKADEIKEILRRAGAENVNVVELKYYWYATYLATNPV